MNHSDSNDIINLTIISDIFLNDLSITSRKQDQIYLIKFDANNKIP